MKSISLAQLYKEHQGKVSDKWQLYLDEYDRLFTPLREKDITLLEIGVQNGWSLEIWANYFKSGEIIIGCDANPSCKILEFDDPRVKIIIGDANNDCTKNNILSLSTSFDIIIDDGSHKSSDIINSFLNFFPRLNIDGIYIIEDLHCSYWKEYEGGLLNPYSSISFFKSLVDIINLEHWGIKKTTPNLLSVFLKKHNLSADDNIFQNIHSVEFINSLCIIRKSTNNQLNKRVIAGKHAAILPNINHLTDTYLTPPDQTCNEICSVNFNNEEYYLIFKKEIESYENLINTLSLTFTQSEKKIRELSIAVSERDKKINKLKSSSSWRLTKPIRKITKSFRKRSRLLRQMMSGSEITSDENNYNKWIEYYDTLTDNNRNQILKEISDIQEPPLISVLMPVYNPQLIFLEKAIQSVQHQLYTNWELCIADDASPNSKVRSLIERYASIDSRIKFVFRKENGHISEASNSALELARGDYFALLDHDDMLHPLALFHISNEIIRYPETGILYSDEDKLNEDGKRSDPYFKPDFNYDLFLCQNMISHLGVYRTSLVRQIGGFRKGLEGSQDYDLALRVFEMLKTEQVRHIPRVLYHWRIHEESTSAKMDVKPYARKAALLAVMNHLERMGVDATVEEAIDAPVFNRVRYRISYPQPSVNIIIPTRGSAAVLNNCINSLLLKTIYRRYAITIINNDTADSNTISLLEKLHDNPNVHVVKGNAPFNLPKQINHAVSVSNADYICLLNSNIEVISPDWLLEMIGHAIQSGVGAVGARLWYPDNTLQHGGVLLGIGTGVGHAHKRLPMGSPGYFGRACLQQSFSAVTGACLIVNREYYLNVGGLNEDHLSISYSDIDLCLKLNKMGLRNIWTPYAEFYHHKSFSEGNIDNHDSNLRLKYEIDYMHSIWSDHLSSDPAYNPNLSNNSEDFSISWPPRS
jgi:glycosyltransferase involved in cell wall biosynthesis